MITENLSTLKINKLTREQYEAALEAGNINENELYMTLEEGADAPATIGYVDEKQYYSLPVEATSEDGVTYTATIPGVTELVDGMTIAAKFSRAARETYPGLNINGLGEILIGRKPSSGQISTPLPLKSNAICAGHTYQLTLMQLIPTNVVTRCWILNDCPVLDTPDLSEPVPIEKGGTGATTVEAARANLGVAASADVDLLKKNWGTITIPVSGWSSTQTDGWYTNQVAVTDMTADYNPYADVVYTSSATVSDEDSAFGCIKEIETGAGIIIAKAIELPTIDVKIRLMGV